MNIANINNTTNPYSINRDLAEQVQQPAQVNPNEIPNNPLQTDIYTPTAETNQQPQRLEQSNTQGINPPPLNENPDEEFEVLPSGIQTLNTADEPPENTADIPENETRGAAALDVNTEPLSENQPPEVPQNETPGNPNQNPTFNIVV